MCEDLAACALEYAGFTNISNLNLTYRRHFPFADLLARENGVWYAISVKGRHRIMASGQINNRYKLNFRKADLAVAELRDNRIEAVPAWIAVEIDADTYTAYFGRLQDSLRENGIGMNEWEKARHRCLAKNRAHGRFSLQKNQYDSSED